MTRVQGATNARAGGHGLGLHGPPGRPYHVPHNVHTCIIFLSDDILMMHRNRPSEILPIGTLKGLTMIDELKHINVCTLLLNG